MAPACSGRGDIILLALVGVTGIGKSYYTELISRELDVKRVHTIRTRPKRPGEIEGVTGYFMSDEQLDELKRHGEIAYDIPLFEGRYGYLKREIFSDDNYVFEMHYTMIDDWKRINPDIVTIYILPRDIHAAVRKVKDRHLDPAIERERIDELEQHYHRFMSDPDLERKFDYMVYNDYDEASARNMLHLVREILAKHRKK